MKVTVIGMGPDGENWLHPQARQALAEAQLCVGSPRLLAALPADCNAERQEALAAEDAARLVAQSGVERVCLLFSGDTGFFSGAKRLLPLLAAYDVTVLPGISSLQMLAARLARPWQDWHLASAHGRYCPAAALVRDNATTFFLTGGEHTAAHLCAVLTEAGFEQCPAVIGASLGNPEERLWQGTVQDLAGCEHSDLAVLLVDNPAPRRAVSAGWPDEAFLRGNVPMTKSEVRAVVLSKLRLNTDDTLFDVGAGTGSLAVEAALLLKEGRVYAIEREQEACALIAANAARFAAANLTVVAGAAPEVLAELPAPQAAFIGGSGGCLPQILAQLLHMNPALRFVISAVSLETLAQAQEALAQLPVKDVEIVQVAISRARKLGEHNLLTAQNPIFLLSGVGNDE